jgi:hypothetical protein
LFPRPRQRLRSVASPVEFIPPDRVVPGLSSWACGIHPFSGGGVTIVRIPPIRVMFWGPHTGAAGPAAILCMRQFGSQDLLFAPQRVRIGSLGNQGTVCNRYPRGMSIPPAHNRSPPCIVIIQYTAYRVVALPPLRSGAFRQWGGDMGGHVLRETTSRGLCGLDCPSRTSERGGGTQACYHRWKWRPGAG